MHHPLKYSVMFAAAIAVAACGGDRADTVDTGSGAGMLATDSTPKAAMSMVRIVNAVPEMNGLAVTSEDRSVFSGVDYKSVSQYQEVEENFARFRLRAGTRDTTIATNNELLFDGSHYTMIALPDDEGGVRLRVLKDELAPDSGKARIRVVHAVPNVGEVDVMVQGREDPLFDNVNFGNEAGFKDVDPMTATITVRTDEGKRQLVRQQMKLEAGHAYTVVVTSAKGKVEAITIDDRAPMKDSM